MAVSQAPQHTVYFDPNGGQTERDVARVYYRPEITWPSPGRPWVIWLAGGAWAPTAGLPGDDFEDISGGQLLNLLWQRGFGVIDMGRTVYDETLDGNGLFDTANWTYAAAADAIRIDPTKVSKRCSELDVVNFIQYLRFTGIGDLDQSDAANGIYGRSMGAHDAAFVGIGLDRRTGSGSDRYNKNTRLGWMITRSTLVNWKSWVSTFDLPPHLPNASGTDANNLSEILANANGQRNVEQASPLFYGFNSTSVKSRNSTMPVWMQGAGPIEYDGPYDWDNFEEEVDVTHPPEHVLAIKEAFLALDTENGTTFHADNSEFRVEDDASETDEDALAVEHYKWILARTGFDDLKPKSDRVLEALKERLETISIENGYRTVVERVTIAPVFAAGHEMPGVVIYEGRSAIDTRSTYEEAAVSMTVTLELVSRGFDDKDSARRCFTADVRKAIATDRTFGEVVDDCVETEVDPFFDRQASERSGAFITLQITYRESNTDPYLDPGC